MRVTHVCAAMIDMDVAQRRGNENVDHLPEHLVGGVAEQLEGLRIREEDDSFVVRHEHAVGSRVERSAERLLARRRLVRTHASGMYPAADGLASDRGSAPLEGDVDA